MKPEKTIAFALVAIAISLAAIAVRMWFFAPATYGELLALKELSQEQKKEAFVSIYQRIPMIWVRGGSIDADVTGSITTDQ